MEFIDRRQSLVSNRLESVLTAVEPDRLAETLAHVTLAGGKRVRPTVTLLSCEAAGGIPESAVDFAVGIELVHTASLVVDDIIDESRIRRNTESAWVKYGHGPALIASDGLLGEAFALFSGTPRATRIVSEALVELGEGEATELVDEVATKQEYLVLARRKTGALFRAAAQLGAVAAEANPETVDAFGEYAERVGVAFQIRDDVLDVTAEDDVMGKPTGHDQEMDRPSILQVTSLSPAAANDLAREQAEMAIEALNSRANLETPAETYLYDLAAFVVERES